MYKIYEQARQGSTNPVDLFKQITKGYTPEQMEKLFSKAKQYGITDDVIQQVKY
jgi:hypothetical protein